MCFVCGKSLHLYILSEANYDQQGGAEDVNSQELIPRLSLSQQEGRSYFEGLVKNNQCFSVSLPTDGSTIWSQLNEAIKAQFLTANLDWAAVSPDVKYDPHTPFYSDIPWCLWKPSTRPDTAGRYAFGSVAGNSIGRQKFTLKEVLKSYSKFTNPIEAMDDLADLPLIIIGKGMFRCSTWVFS